MTDGFNNSLEFQGKIYISIQQLINKLTTKEDDQIKFQRIKYDEIIDYLPRQICPSNKYKEDEYWFLRDENPELYDKVLENYKKRNSLKDLCISHGYCPICVSTKDYFKDFNSE